MFETKITKEEREIKWRNLYEEGVKAGLKAGNKFTPTPMIVQEHENMLDDNSPVKKEWFISDGVCGFAWVVIKPGNCSFAIWLKKNGLARKYYYGGVSISVREYNQSMQKKEAYATAMTKVFRNAGINAYSQSRLD